MLSVEDLFLDGAKFLMKPFGVWVPIENEPIINKARRYFMILIQYLFLTLQVVYIIQAWGDVDAMTQAAYVLFIQSYGVFKMTVFHVNIERVKEILAIMNEDIMQPKNDAHKKILKLQAARYKIPQMLFALSSQINNVIFSLRPLFDADRTFGFDLWMPLDPKKPFQFFIGSVLQLTTICSAALVYYGVDSVVFCSIGCACAQLDVIKEKILKITPVFNKRPSEVQEIRVNNYVKLVECVKHHQTVVRLTGVVEDAFHSCLFFKLSGSVGIICMSALKITDLETGSMQYSSVLLFVFLVTLHLYICCWCGHELTAKSENLCLAMYQCLWYEQDLKFKRALCLAMVGMGPPLMVRAGHYIQLSRSTFVSIIRLSYSYFAVLRQTKMRN